MTEEELKYAIIDLLYDLHAKNLLTEYVVNSISLRFKVDADKLCETNGITYSID